MDGNILEFTFVAFSLLCLIGFLLNVVMLISIFSNTTLSKSVYAFNINLAFADLLSCTTGLALLAMRMSTSFTLVSNTFVCQWFGYLIAFSNALSVYSLLAMTIAHFFTFWFATSMMNSERRVLLLFPCWFLALALPVIPKVFFYSSSKIPLFVTQPSNLYCIFNFVSDLSDHSAFYLGIPICLILTPYVIGVIYFLIWYKMVGSNLPEFVKLMWNGEFNMPVVQSVTKINILLIRRSLSLIVSFALVWFIPAYFMIYQIVTKKEVTWEEDTIVAMLLMAKNTVNPIVFFNMDKNCKQALIRLFGDRIPSRNEEIPKLQTPKSFNSQ